MSEIKKVTLRIFRKERELVSNDGENYFLNNKEDANELGIYHSLPLEKWRDELYLITISGNASHLRELFFLDRLDRIARALENLPL